MGKFSRFLPVTVLFLIAIPALAQFNASLQGTIQDPTGAVIPGAHVKLLNNGTQATMDTTANGQGFYRFNQLPAGTYTLTVDAQGFQSSTISNIVIVADRPQSTDATLQPGKIESTTTVTAEAAPMLQTADGSVSDTISSAAVQDLPTFGRDPYELIRTVPGITGEGGRNGTGLAVTLGNTSGPGGSNAAIFQTENQVQISSSGQRVEQNVYLIDGVTVNSLGWGGAAVVTPNSESVADITVVSSDFAAEDGRDSGAHTKVDTKSGTNQFHGSGVFRFQDPNFNAYNKWGGPNSALPIRVQSNFRQYAGSVGGPILKNKLFFFLSYEGLHNKTINYGQGYVTTPQYRALVLADRPNGLVARVFATSNVNPRIVSVLPTSCAIAGFGTAYCRDVPGGLDLGSLSPGSGPGDPYVAIPGNPGSTGGGFDGIPDMELVQYSQPGEQIGNQYNGRFDFNLSPSDTLFFSTYITHVNSVSSDAAAAAAPGADLYFKPTNTAYTAGYIKTINPTMINELRGNFTRFAENGLTDNKGINFGIPRLQVEAYPGPVGRPEVAGVAQGGTTPGILAQNTYEARDTLTKVWGAHTVRFGGQFRWEQNNNNTLGSNRPLYSFSGLWNLANDAPIFESISANVQNGGPTNSAFYFRDHTFAAFAQDDWHVSPSLTLNLGLRWEYFSPLTEARGQAYNIFLSATGPEPLANAQVRNVGQLWNDNWKNFMPKIGFAYAPVSLQQKVVVRGGFAIAYNEQNGNIFANTRQDNPNNFGFNLCCGTALPPVGFASPFAGGEIQFNLGNGTSPNSYPANPFLATGINPASGTPNSLVPGTPPPAIQVYGAWPNTPDAYTYLYSFETQVQLARSVVLTVGYQGAVSHHLVRLFDQNFLYPASAGGLGPYFSDSFFATPDVNSSYNGMNAHIVKQFSRGFSIDATYTWSKSIDMLSAEGPGAQTNQTDPVHAQTTEYGPSDFDARHRFTASGLWTLPIFTKNKGLLHTLLGGWQVGGIVTAYSGFPWTPVTGNQASVAPVAGANTISPTRPVGYFGNAGDNYSNTCFQNGCNFGGTSQTSVINGLTYFDNSHAGPPGIGRNSLRGPHFFSTDASLAKQFAVPWLGESAGLEFRGYAYNVFNQLNLTPFYFNDSDTHVESGNFGRPASALSGRSIELQVRLTF